MTIQTFETSQGTSVSFVGPSLEEGPMPTLFYFALSAEDSLQKEPFNQPVQFLKGSSFRIFSMTLPGHENHQTPENAMTVWAEKMAKGKTVIPTFIEEVKEAIDHLTPYFQDGKLAIAGLSRGAFIACHVAAVCPQITHILGFAPLTKLSSAKAFRDNRDESLNLEHLIPKLLSRSIRFYIGNADTQVETKHAFSFIHKLAKAAQESNIRSPPIELIIGPSIGRHGHGTSPDVFQSGIDYLKERLLK